jgi:hypothetical protein
MHENVPGWPPIVGERVKVKGTDRVGVVAKAILEDDDRLYVVDLEAPSGGRTPEIAIVVEGGSEPHTYKLEELEPGR